MVLEKMKPVSVMSHKLQTCIRFDYNTMKSLLAHQHCMIQ